ncbi:uncharacterized protein LOC113169939 isoform X2 [Anabas testudineus]|uniref:uncharacterized protein LOC113169939 isoform X2 n=1 Tax=Anabas testudineus TaxID=64144 RepID=UPI000E4586EB|nr:uncharacterized protein LOC113169939 isoform X2 [Anabas testudineus]
MKPHCLIDLSLLLILALNSKGKGFVTATNSEDRDAQFTTEATNEPPSAATSTTVHVATFVPVSALVIIIIVSGIICYIKCKRSQTFTREESGYYANFSRASSNQAKSETLCKIHEDVKLPEPTVIDEPVYVNTEVTAAAPMAQSLDHKESIYANVDYSK